MVSLFGRSVEIYLDKFEGDVYLQRFDAEYVTNAATEFCKSQRSVFRISEAAMDRGCVKPVFNQLFVQINTLRDMYATRSQEENEARLEHERLEDIANAKEVLKLKS